MRIIGIDPGTAITGFSIIESIKGEITLLDYGCIRTPAGLGDSARLQQIAEDMEELIKEWKPQHASVEKLFFNKNVKTAMTVSQARGVILQKLVENNIQETEFTPMQIKSAVCGNGRADKKMVQKMVQLILGLKEIPKPDDAADAIAAALCLAQSIKISQ